jgi:hypothetical protein
VPSIHFQPPDLLILKGVTPVICMRDELFQFLMASGKLKQDAILTGKPE